MYKSRVLFINHNTIKSLNFQCREDSSNVNILLITNYIDEVSGDEDCLVLDVYVPEGVDKASTNTDRKAVMVWFHGGGYILGAGVGYPAGILAVVGDVIVVTFNYRIGPLGFLSQGPGAYTKLLQNCLIYDTYIHIYISKIHTFRIYT